MLAHTKKITYYSLRILYETQYAEPVHCLDVRIEVAKLFVNKLFQLTYYYRIDSYRNRCKSFASPSRKSPNQVDGFALHVSWSASKFQTDRTEENENTEEFYVKKTGKYIIV